MSSHAQVQQLLDFIDASPSPWHAVASLEQQLLSQHFQRLDETDCWTLQPTQRYYVIRDDSSIIAWIMASTPLAEHGFKIVGAHTDSPGLRVKPQAINHLEGFLRVNVEVYGGPILATFADRDLSLAGRLTYKNEQGDLANTLVRFDAPLLRLPNLAIHMNRGVNEDGLKLQKHAELPLILSTLAEEQLPADYFTSLLREHSKLDTTKILAWDLAIYDTQKGTFWGANDEFYANSQLDNLASCHAAMTALLTNESATSPATQLCAFFDHEEVGSESHKGAAGSFLPDILQRIAFATQTNAEDFARAMAHSFLISADMAHAYQPSFPLAYDADHKAIVNQGPVIKVNANQRYSTESPTEALFINWCQEAGVPYQKYSHRCDLPCGSTIGPITSAKLGVRSLDIGNPMWAMHSLRESAGVFDHQYLIRVLQHFFKAT